MRRNPWKIFDREDIFYDRIKGEHELMRYIKFLENKDINLTRSMIPLGSCTMKLNAAVEMIPLSWQATNIHPYVPRDQAKGYLKIVEETERLLCLVTKMDGVSFQPNSGATGEYCGLLAIRGYQHSIGQSHRNIC